MSRISRIHRISKKSRQTAKVRQSRTGPGLQHLRYPTNRGALLVGTALTSLILVGSIATPTTAQAQVVTCAGDNDTSPAPIVHTMVNNTIDCVNNLSRNATADSGAAIKLSTSGSEGGDVILYNQGNLKAVSSGDNVNIQGMDIKVFNSAKSIEITNTSDSRIDVESSGYRSSAIGIMAYSAFDKSIIHITNRTNSHIEVTTGKGIKAPAFGIRAMSRSGSTYIDNDQSTIVVTTESNESKAAGIYADSQGMISTINANIYVDNNNVITVTTAGDQANADGIYAFTLGHRSTFNYIYVTTASTSKITVETKGAGSAATGINVDALTQQGDAQKVSHTYISNLGSITVTTADHDSNAYGIKAYTAGDSSPIKITNSAVISAGTAGLSSNAYGIKAKTLQSNGYINIFNEGEIGEITVTTARNGSYAVGIVAVTAGGSSSTTVTNSAVISAETTGNYANAVGIFSETQLSNGNINIYNEGADGFITVTANGDGSNTYGILAVTNQSTSDLVIDNSGGITVTTAGVNSNAFGISTKTDLGVQNTNTGEIRVTTANDNADALGIYAKTKGPDGSTGGLIDINNSGDITVTAKGYDSNAHGIYASALRRGSATVDKVIDITNSGNINVVAELDTSTAKGISTRAAFANTNTAIHNSAVISAETRGNDSTAYGIHAKTEQPGSTICINSTLDQNGICKWDEGTNSGSITVTAEGSGSNTHGILAVTEGGASAIGSYNSGTSTILVTAKGDGSNAYGIKAKTAGIRSTINIDNSGGVTVTTGGSSWITGYSFVHGLEANAEERYSKINITNSGDISVTAEQTVPADVSGITASVNNLMDVSSRIDISNSGDIWVVSNDRNLAGSVTGIQVKGQASSSAAVVTNDGGIIGAARFDSDTLNSPIRGTAIDVSDTHGGFTTINLNASQEQPGHIFGDIRLEVQHLNGEPTPLAEEATINVTGGKTYFDGTIFGRTTSAFENKTLNISDGGELILCQEGWKGACDPNGWGNHFNPEVGENAPSNVEIDIFTMGRDGTITYQLTSNNTPDDGKYPVVQAKTANLDGNLVADPLGDTTLYDDPTRYNGIIAADKPLTDKEEFYTVGSTSALLRAEAYYDRPAGTVDLELKRIVFNEVAGLRTNQFAVASVFENDYATLLDEARMAENQGAGDGDISVRENGAAVQLDPSTANPFSLLTAKLFTISTKADYRTGMNQLSGVQYAQFLQSLLWSARPLNESITDRMDCDGVDGQIADRNGNTVDRFGCFKPGEVNAWGRMWGGWNSNDGNISVPGYDENQFGFWGGVDYAITSALFVGVAGGYFDSAMDFGSWGGGTIDYDGGQFAVYGGWDDAVWYNRAILSFGSYSGDSQRNITTIGLTSGPEGRFDADVVSFYNELGRRVAVGGTSQLTPFLGLNVGDAQMDGFTERDPRRTGAALNLASSSANSLSTRVGLRYNGVWGALRPQLAVGWEHEFKDTAQSVIANFVDSPSKKKFPVTGSDLDADSLFVDAGGAYLLGTSSDLSFRYVGRWQSEYDSQSVMGRYTYKFGGAAEAVPVTQPLKLGNK